jgi:hypothetical protein
MPIDTFKSQRRRQGVAGMTVKDTDEVSLLVSANTHDSLFGLYQQRQGFQSKNMGITRR